MGVINTKMALPAMTLSEVLRKKTGKEKRSEDQLWHCPHEEVSKTRSNWQRGL